MNEIKVLSLFSGGGGLDIGFAKAGFSIIASNDVEKLFCETLESNRWLFGDQHKVIWQDIAKFEPSNYGINSVDFIIGGPPCQSFSAAGRRAGGVYGLNDIRGSLFWHYCRILRELKPAGFLFENVRGILAANNKSAWATITESFSSIGYRLFYQVLDAAEYGVPQHRERIILVGSNRDGKFLFPRPTHGPGSKDRVDYFGALDAIRDLQNKDEQYIPYGGMYEDLLLEIPPGMNYLHFTEKMGHPRPRFAWRSRFSDFLYIADPNKPTKTIVAHPGKWAGPFHWKKRKFTIAELKRLFTFPDEYVVKGSEINITRQLGNSVPPKFALSLAMAVKKQFYNGTDNVDLIDEDFKFDYDKRKARKATSTKKAVRPNDSIYHSDQPMLFKEEQVDADYRSEFDKRLWYRSYRDVQEVADKRLAKEERIFCIKAKLSDKVWEIDVYDCLRGKYRCQLEIDFIKPIQGKFEGIKVKFRAIDPAYICVMWDAVDLSIQDCTSYDNIQKLYGHFTEPYPQFRCRILSKSKSAFVRFAQKICDFNYLEGYHPLSQLEDLFGTQKKGVSIAKWLRERGFDIRTNETNRTIPEGYFRVCYPFTTPLTSRQFVSWIEKGQHRTADRTSIPPKKL